MLDLCHCGHSAPDHFQIKLQCKNPTCKCQIYIPTFPPISRRKVESSNLVSAGYSRQHQTMTVEFKSGAVYFYNQVTPEEFTAFEKTFDNPEQSSGSYFYKNLRSKEFFGKVFVAPKEKKVNAENQTEK